VDFQRLVACPRDKDLIFSFTESFPPVQAASVIDSHSARGSFPLVSRRERVEEHYSNRFKLFVLIAQLRSVEMQSTVARLFMVL
jgi:hypothetical protein